MNFLSSSHTLLLTLVVHIQNFLEQQPLSHMSFANQLIFKLCFSWLLTSMQESRGKVVFRQIKKMETKRKRNRRHGHCPVIYSSYSGNNYETQAVEPASHAALSKLISPNPEVWPIQVSLKGQRQGQSPISAALPQTGNLCLLFSEMPPKSSVGI